MSQVEISRVNRGWVMRSEHHLSSEEFEAALSQISRNGGGTVRWFVCQSDATEQSTALAHGFVVDAPLLHMRCSLPLDAKHRLPDNFTTRSFRPGVDDEQWLALNARAFADHPEQGDWDLNVLRARIAEPWFDADGFLIHEHQGRMAGFCWTKVHQESHADAHATSHEPVGEIYVIGVDPDFHGLGLGRALTVAGFAYLANRGLKHGMLYVAGDNTAAIRLYESLGMAVAHQDDVFVGSVSPSTA